MLRKKFIIFLLMLSVVSCSKGDDNNIIETITYEYVAFLSDDCDCNSLDIPICYSCIEINENEYLRLLDIQQSSTEPCNYVNIASEVINPNQIFGPEGPVEGYLISLGEGHCISGGGGGHPI